MGSLNAMLVSYNIGEGDAVDATVASKQLVESLKGLDNTRAIEGQLG
jgi:hypothetical protein